jgi:hypothetical protein
MFTYNPLNCDSKRPEPAKCQAPAIDTENYGSNLS